MRSSCSEIQFLSATLHCTQSVTFHSTCSFWQAGKYSLGDFPHEQRLHQHTQHHIAYLVWLFFSPQSSYPFCCIDTNTNSIVVRRTALSVFQLGGNKLVVLQGIHNQKCFSLDNSELLLLPTFTSPNSDGLTMPQQ